jgi:hypothetical protein
MKPTATRYPRIDWQAERIDLAAVVTRLLGPPPGRRGERGRRLWWHCSFHEDRNPSFCVDTAKPWWRCYGCGEKGDAATLVMRLEGVTFPEAIARLTGGPAPRRKAPGKALTNPGERPALAPRPEPSGLPGADALALVEAAADRLWTPEGAGALAYLTGPNRSLSPETIRAAKLGFAPTVRATTRDGRPYTAGGIVIPWFAGGALTLVKVRQPEGTQPKYVEVFRDRGGHPGIYPGPEAVRPGRPLIVVEGEFDALCLVQELIDLAPVVTLGSASARPGPAILGRMLIAAPWFVATDGDGAGDRSAGGWPPSARRVRPPAPYKDWTVVKAVGVDLARWWRDVLAGVERPVLFTPGELSRWRWGPAENDDTPSADNPRGRFNAGSFGRATDPEADPDVRTERGAIRVEPPLPANHPFPAAQALAALLERLRGRGITVDGRTVHPRIAVGTVTGRVSYADPALQTMPKADRSRRISPVVAGRVFVRADYGQIEPRIVLAILRRRGLIAWEPGPDLYRTLIGEGDRDSAKVAVNQVINGGRPDPGASDRLAEFIAAADAYRTELAAAARGSGQVETLAGRSPCRPRSPTTAGRPPTAW